MAFSFQTGLVSILIATISLGFNAVALCAPTEKVSPPADDWSRRESSARSEFRRELQVIGARTARGNPNILSALRNAAELDDLTEAGEAGFLSISLAVVDKNYDQTAFTRKYPEIWQRSNIIDIATFSRETGRQVFLKKCQHAGGPLKLVALSPESLLRGERNAMVAIALDDFVEGDPVKVIQAGGSKFIRIRHQTKPSQRDPEHRTFLLIEYLVSFDGRKFELINSKQTELPAEKYVDPSAPPRK